MSEYDVGAAMDLADEITGLMRKYAEMHNASWVSARVNIKKKEFSFKHGGTP